MAEGRNRLAITIGLVLVLLLLIAVIQVSSVAVRTWQPLQQADQANQKLEARFGPAGSFTPSPDGGLASERVEAFLQVRRNLVADCEQYAPIGEAFDLINELDESGEPDARGVWHVMKMTLDASRKITPFVGQFFQHRNQALLNAGLSLDEYNYLYVSAYWKQLSSVAHQKEVFSSGVERSAPLLDSFRQMITRQHAASQDEMKQVLARELEAMAADPQRFPWQEGLPAVTEQSLAGYRGELDELFCAGTAGIAMDRDSGRAIHIALE
jgi:hypothetical protein